MLTRNGTDTVIGWCPGPDEANTNAGDGDRVMVAAADWAGWAGVPMEGVYSYPTVSDSEDWVYKAHGSGPLSVRALAIPEGFDLDAAMAGECDDLWRKRARFMVDRGLGDRVRYLPGYEGNGNNFNGSAGLIGDAGWSAAVSRQIRIMREVDGFDPWIGINYSAYQARDNGLDPIAAFGGISEPFQSVDMDWYDTDNFKGQYPITDIGACVGFMLDQYEAQLEVAGYFALPLGFDEWGAITRSDGHGGGDRVEVIDAALDWIWDHDVAHVDYYNGSNLPGDDCRVADLSDALVYSDAAAYPNVAAWIKANLDPAKFLNRDGTDPEPGPTPPDDDRLTALEGRVADLEAWKFTAGQLALGEI